MNTLSILNELPQLFRYADVAKYTGNANVFLTRALSRGLVTRVSPGVYANATLKGLPAVEEVACFLRTPSYVSCEWALDLHGVLAQAPTVLTVITLAPTAGARSRIVFHGVTVEHSRISPALFSGFEPREGFNLATPEKALLDTLYLHRDLPAHDELELERLDRTRLAALAALFPATVRRAAEKLVKSTG